MFGLMLNHVSKRGSWTSIRRLKGSMGHCDCSYIGMRVCVYWLEQDTWYFEALDINDVRITYLLPGYMWVTASLVCQLLKYQSILATGVACRLSMFARDSYDTETLSTLMSVCGEKLLDIGSCSSQKARDAENLCFCAVNDRELLHLIQISLKFVQLTINQHWFG